MRKKTRQAYHDCHESKNEDDRAALRMVIIAFIIGFLAGMIFIYVFMVSQYGMS